MLTGLLGWLIRISGWSGRRLVLDATLWAEDPVPRHRADKRASVVDLALVAVAEHVLLLCVALLSAALLRVRRDWRRADTVSHPARRVDSPRAPPRWRSR